MNNKKIFLLLGILILAVLGTAIILFPKNETNIAVTNHSEENQPVIASVEGSYVSIPLEEQIKQVDSIALISVQNVGAAQWSTKDGTAPEKSPQEYIQEGNAFPVIFRPVTLKIEQYLKAPQRETEIIIHLLGGEINGVVFEASQIADLEEGDRAIVFLNRQTQPPSPIPWEATWVYKINSNTAYSKMDDRTVPVDELIAAIEDVTK